MVPSSPYLLTGDFFFWLLPGVVPLKAAVRQLAPELKLTHGLLHRESPALTACSVMGLRFSISLQTHGKQSLRGQLVRQTSPELS